MEPLQKFSRGKLLSKQYFKHKKSVIIKYCSYIVQVISTHDHFIETNSIKVLDPNEWFHFLTTYTNWPPANRTNNVQKYFSMVKYTILVMLVLNCSRMLFSMIAITIMFESMVEENIRLCKQQEIMNTWIHIINERYFMAIADLNDTPIAIRNSQSVWPCLTGVFVCALNRERNKKMFTSHGRYLNWFRSPVCQLQIMQQRTRR